MARLGKGSMTSQGRFGALFFGGSSVGDVVPRAKFRAGWHGGLPETPCGAGSTLANTQAQRAWIPEIVARYGVRSIADIGAGDLNWLSRMPLHGVEYSAYDLVPRRAEVQEFDLVREVPPRVDLLLCLWVLNHLPLDDCRAAIRNLRASGSRFLMMTDRPRWHAEQPDEIRMPYIEDLVIDTVKGDRILLVPLC